jgi:hypothetical protein
MLVYLARGLGHSFQSVPKGKGKARLLGLKIFIFSFSLQLLKILRLILPHFLF